jgi:tetratricopeptide (TPR) repeat protein
MMLALLLGLPGLGQSYVVESIRLKKDRTATKLEFKADGTLKFRVDLAGPQTVVLHLPGAHLATDIPSVKKDRLLSGIKSQFKPDSIVLFIQTRSPGVTVLPSYEAVSRKLTLEFGGPPDFEQSVDQADAMIEEDNPDQPAENQKPTDSAQNQAAQAAAQRPAPSVRDDAKSNAASKSVIAEPEAQTKTARVSKQTESIPAASAASQISTTVPEAQAAPPEAKSKPDTRKKVRNTSTAPQSEPKPETKAAPEEPKAKKASRRVVQAIPPGPQPLNNRQGSTKKAAVVDPAARLAKGAIPPPPASDPAPDLEQEPAKSTGPVLTESSTVEQPVTADASANRKKAAPAEPVQDPSPLVKGIRRGTHADYTRIVLDSERPMAAHVAPEDRRIVISLERGRLNPDAAIASADGRISGIRVIQTEPLRLEIGLQGYLAKQKMFTLDQGKKVVLDLETTDQPPQAPVAPKIPEPEKTQASQNTPEPLKESRPAKLAANTQDQQTNQTRTQAKASPKAAKFQPAAGAIIISQSKEPGRVAAPKNAAQKRQAPAAVKQKAESKRGRPNLPRAATSKLSDLVRRPKAEVPRAKTARVNSRFPAFAQGGIPPMPPPAPVARPRGPITQPGSTGPAANQSRAVVIGPGAKNGTIVQPSTKQVIQKVETAESREQAQQTAQPQAVKRPPQAALLGAAGREDVEGTREFEIAKAEFDSRRFRQAYEAFDNFLKRHPNHRLAEEAQFRIADAYFNLHEREFLPYYPMAMQHYQKAIDKYPKSDQVPWALLMMGRAAMLGGEAYKAAGYFEVVIEDYPKSEYVPLALVQRAQAYLADGKMNQALEEFRQVAQRYPNSRYRKDADWGQAQALFSMARYQRASLLLKDMDRRDPGLRIGEPELLYYIGEADFQQKNYREARAYFLWALNLMPNLPDADIVLTRVGDTYKFENDHKAAKDIYRRVVNLFPDTDGALVARIRLAESPIKNQEHPYEVFAVKATTDAYKTYREIASTHPDREVGELARLKLGVYYYKRKEYQLALDTMRGLLTDNPNTVFKPQLKYTINLTVLGILEQAKAQNRPLALMNSYMQFQSALTRPNGDRVLKLLAWAYEKNGLYDRAQNLYEKLLSRGLVEPGIKLGLARTQVKKRKYAKVPELLRPDVVADLKGTQLIEAHSMLGRAYAKLGEYEMAVERLSQAVAQRSAGPEAARDFHALGLAYTQMKEPLEALDALGSASQILQNDPSPTAKALHYLVAMDGGAAALQARRVDISKSFYELAIKNAPSSPERAQAMYSLAQALQRVDDLKSAMGVWQKLAQLRAEPWSGMANRHLDDVKLAPTLTKVGR